MGLLQAGLRQVSRTPYVTDTWYDIILAFASCQTGKKKSRDERLSSQTLVCFWNVRIHNKASTSIIPGIICIIAVMDRTSYGMNNRISTNFVDIAVGVSSFWSSTRSIYVYSYEYTPRLFYEDTKLSYIRVTRIRNTRKYVLIVDIFRLPSWNIIFRHPFVS